MQPRRLRLFPVLAGVFLWATATASWAQNCWYHSYYNSGGSAGEYRSPWAWRDDSAALLASCTDYVNWQAGHTTGTPSNIWVDAQFDCRWTQDGNNREKFDEVKEDACPEQCPSGQLAWHQEVIPPGNENFYNWSPPETVDNGGCVYAPITDIDSGCGDTSREQINAMSEADNHGHMEDGSYRVNMAMCSTGSTSNQEPAAVAPVPPDHPTPYTVEEKSSKSTSKTAPVETTDASGNTTTEQTETITEDFGSTVSFVDFPDYNIDSDPIATYEFNDKGERTTVYETTVINNVDGSTTTIIKQTVTTVKPTKETRDLRVPVAEGDGVFESGGSETTTTTTTTTENSDGSETTETTTEGDGDCVGDSCAEEEATGEYDTSEADGLFDQLVEAIGKNEVADGVAESELPTAGAEKLPGYGACQSLSMSWASYTFIFPGTAGCQKIETFKSILDWAAWIVLLMLLFGLVLRSPGT